MSLSKSNAEKAEPLQISSISSNSIDLLTILAYQKIFNKVFQWIEFNRYPRLRLVCGLMNKWISSSSLYLDHARFHIVDLTTIQLFTNSTINWKSIYLSYWPQTFDDVPIGNNPNSYQFWIQKGPYVTQLWFYIQPHLKLTYPKFYELLASLTNLELLSISSPLLNFNLYNELRYEEKAHLKETFKNLKHLYILNCYATVGCNHDKLIRHLSNCWILTRVLTLCQLISFHITATKNSTPLCYYSAECIGTVLLSIISEHFGSLKSLGYEGIIPAKILADMLQSPRLQLATLSIDIIQSIGAYEKADVSTLDQDPAKTTLQVRAWRELQAFLKRQLDLKDFKICIRHLNKKISKQLFPKNCLDSLQYISLSIHECFEANKSFAFLHKCSKLIHLLIDIWKVMMKDGEDLIKSEMLQCIPASQLHSLSININAYTHLQLNHVLEKCNPSLMTKLHILSECLINDETVQVICQYLVRLKELILHPATSLTDEGLIGQYNVNRLKELRVLRISGASKITNVTLRRGFKFPEIQYLEIPFCQKVTDRGILDVLSKENCPYLICLNITGLKIPMKAYKKFYAKRPGLQILNHYRPTPTRNTDELELESVIPDQDSFPFIANEGSISYQTETTKILESIISMTDFSDYRNSEHHSNKNFSNSFGENNTSPRFN